MSHLIIDSAVGSPQGVVAPRLLSVLRTYAEQTDFTLTAEFGIAGATISVPVHLEIGPSANATSVPLTLEARARTDWFPSFEGEARSEEQGALASRLRLIGDYEVPLGAIGVIVNRRLLGRAAERSLRAFVERLRTDVLAEIERSELMLLKRESGHF